MPDPWVNRDPRRNAVAVLPPQLPATVRAPVRVQGQMLRVREVASARIRPGALTAALLGAVTAGIHGYLRNRSVGWAAAWAVGGFVCPAVTITFAISQGFGRRAL